MNIVIACTGSEWYRDDRAGLIVCRNLQQALPERLGICNVSIVECETGLERCLGLITRNNPDVVIFVDAVRVVGHEENLRSGSVIVIDNVVECESLQDAALTHKLSIKTVSQLINYLVGHSVRCVFVGIVVENLELCLEENCELSEEVKKGVERCVNIVREIVRDLCYG